MASTGFSHHSYPFCGRVSLSWAAAYLILSCAWPLVFFAKTHNSNSGTSSPPATYCMLATPNLLNFRIYESFVCLGQAITACRTAYALGCFCPKGMKTARSEGSPMLTGRAAARASAYADLELLVPGESSLSSEAQRIRWCQVPQSTE